MYTRYVGPLSIGERQRYYEEQMLLAEKFGVPRSEQPASYGEFYEYFNEMLASDAIAVTDALRDVVDATLNPPLPRVARPIVEALNLATVGMLPAGLRADLDCLGAEPPAPLRRVAARAPARCRCCRGPFGRSRRHAARTSACAAPAQAAAGGSDAPARRVPHAGFGCMAACLWGGEPR